MRANTSDATRHQEDQMAHRSEPGESEPIIDRATDWLNGKLYRYIGPADLGPFETGSEVIESSRPCPICGHPLVEHPNELDRETGHHFLHHPDPAFPDVMEIG
jgi:hypothetical protein